MVCLIDINRAKFLLMQFCNKFVNLNNKTCNNATMLKSSSDLITTCRYQLLLFQEHLLFLDSS